MGGSPVNVPSFLTDASLRLVLFGGKGGVGKTTCAAAAALSMSGANPDKSFMIVSTDPAHSLMDSLKDAQLPVNLKTLEFNSKEHIDAFKKQHEDKIRKIAERGTFLDNEDINRLMELTLPGMDELMGFMEISGWVRKKSYDCIIVDTAPTGHTLRLLSMPAFIRTWLQALDALLAKHRYMKKLFSGVYKHDDLDDFILELHESANLLDNLLQNRKQSRFVPVMIAEELGIQETEDLLRELHKMKIHTSEIIVNRIFPANGCGACSLARRGQIEKMSPFVKKEMVKGNIFWQIPLYNAEVVGKSGLEIFWKGAALFEDSDRGPESTTDSPRINTKGCLEKCSSSSKLLIFAGKGGVGKTTLASATAVRLARESPGKKILLFSADPAHSLSDCLDRKFGPEPLELFENLSVIEMNAKREYDALKKQYLHELKQFMSNILPNLDLTFDREVMERILDLSPPGLDEIMAITSVMDLLDSNKYDMLVLDTAPTGHFLRLLEMPEIVESWLKVIFELFLKYKNIFKMPKVNQRLIAMSKGIKRMKKLLHSPEQSSLYVVTIPNEMAWQETRDLVAACGRMDIKVAGIFVNMASVAGDCPVCGGIEDREKAILRDYRETFNSIPQALIYRSGDLRGSETLEALGLAMYCKGSGTST